MVNGNIKGVRPQTVCISHLIVLQKSLLFFVKSWYNCLICFLIVKFSQSYHCDKFS